MRMHTVASRFDGAVSTLSVTIVVQDCSFTGTGNTTSISIRYLYHDMF